ncbi:hypothetical protein HD806DRAFT_520969 [Xylariaceae sp. AK1471]|nr:hypothetical protein HD806DRAFT_520969 [Xylariaceae sp. AK1471]
MADSSTIEQRSACSAFESCLITVKLSPTVVKKLKEELAKKKLAKEPTFTLFNKLPPELRAIIWKYAVYTQDRLVQFVITPPTTTRYLEGAITISNAPVPPLFLVSKEAYGEVQPYYVRLDHKITATSPQTSTGPLISFENDIFHYADPRSAPPYDLIEKALPWSTLRRITEPRAGENRSVNERIFQVLSLRGSKRLALDQDVLQNYCAGPSFFIGPLAGIEMLGWILDLDELRVISRHGHQVAFTRHELETLDTKLQRYEQRTNRTKRTMGRCMQALIERNRSQPHGSNFDVEKRIYQWIMDDLRHSMLNDHHWYRNVPPTAIQAGRLIKYDTNDTKAEERLQFDRMNRQLLDLVLTKQATSPSGV